LLESAEVRSISVQSPADELRRLAPDLTAHATVRSGSQGADAIAIHAGASREETKERLDAATRSNASLLIVLDPDERRRADVERWAFAHDDWLMLDEPPAGTAVLAPIDTLVRRPALRGNWRGGRSSPADSESQSEEIHALVARMRIETEAQRIEIDRLRAQLLAERAWVAAEAERVRGSSSWRLGHRLVRIARLLTLRRDRGTDGLTRMVERMRTPVGT
jgi:hypothetical protein